MLLEPNTNVVMQVLQARLDMLYRTGGIAILTNVSIVVLTALALSNVIDHSVLYPWATLSIMLSAIRLYLNNAYGLKLSHADQTVNDYQFYEQTYVVGAILSGLLWGVLSLYISADWPISELMIIAVVIFGLASGGAAFHVSSLRSYYGFIIPMTLPLALSFYMQGFTLIALISIANLGVMLFLFYEVHKKLIDSLKHQCKNQQQIQHLANVNQQQSTLLDELKGSKNFLKYIFDAGIPTLLINKNFQIVDANTAASELAGYNQQEMSSKSLADFIHKEDAQRSVMMLNSVFAGNIDSYQGKRRFKTKAGNTLWMNSTVTGVEGADGEVEFAIVQSQDVTREYKLNEQLTYQSLHDEVTGLANRYAFESHLQQLLSHDMTQEHVLCYFDIDQFKVVNDNCGHDAGDQLLRNIAHLLQQELRPADFLARVGGDEFIVVITHTKLTDARDYFTLLLRKIRDYIFVCQHQSFNITASLGVVALRKGHTVSRALVEADSACYIAKEEGRDRLHVFCPEDNLFNQRKGMMQWVAKVQQALEQDSFILYQQQIVDTAGTDTLPHFELLIRLQDGQGKIIPQDLFIPAVESYGLAASIDLWVVKHVVKTLTTALSNGKDIGGVYGINISGQSLGDSRFFDEIIEIIGQNELIRSNAILCFEITETAAISNIDNALYFINKLQAVGCQFALDDFGSGLSSFAYLKQMPVDYLKIDGMFVKDCLVDQLDLQMVIAINSLGHAMNVKTIAEYVENKDLYDEMSMLEVDYVQGYWNGPPAPWFMYST